MVFFDKAAIRVANPSHQDDQWDNLSASSTHSKNSGLKQPKIDQEKTTFNIQHEWHVVPTGGAKAMNSVGIQHPYPCRYDEYDTYKPTGKMRETDQGLEEEKDYKMPLKHRNNEHEKDMYDNTSSHVGSNDRRTTQMKYMGMAQKDASKHTYYQGQYPQQKLGKTAGENKGKDQKETDADSHNDSNKQAEDGGDKEKGEKNVTNRDKGQDDGGQAKETGDDSRDAASGDDGKGTGGSGGNRNGTGNEDDKDKGKEKETETQTPSPGHDIKVLQTFTLEFNIRTTPANKIGYVHKQFINEILTVAPNTTFEASNKRTIPQPASITTTEEFPRDHLLHQKFFYRLDIREKVKYTHHVYSPVSVLDIKRRAMAFLQEHDLGMWNDEISNNSKVRVCWILNAHSRVTYKPQMKEKLCIGINQQQANRGDDNNRLLTQLPKQMHDIDLYTKTVSHQGHQTEAVCVMAYKPAAPVIRELVGMLDHAYLGNGTSIVSDAAVRELDGNKYSQIIDENTAFHQNTRTISVKFFHDLYWNQKYRPSKEANYTTIREWVMTGSGVVSIEPTKDTDSEGRYIILCKSEGFPTFKRVLQVMCQSLVKTIEDNDELRDIALKKYQQYPTIIGPHKIGKYAEQNAKGLLSRIDAPTVPKPSIKRISTKIEFDFGSAEGFPSMQPSILNRRPSVRKSQKQQSWAEVASPPATMDTSNTSIASESEAGRSIQSNNQSVRTGITNTDQQTVQSEAMSVLTEFISQARTEDAERRREDKEERRIEREERKEEAARRQKNDEMRQRNEERRDENNRIMFQSMMAMMAQNTTRQLPVTTAQQLNDTQSVRTGPNAQGETTVSSSDGLNKEGKRRKKNGETEEHAQDIGKAMDVEESQQAGKNHDTQQGGKGPLLH